MIGIFMNECIDSTMGRNPRMLDVLLASDDPRTSWSFQLVTKESGFTGALTSRAFPLDCERPDQLVAVFALQLPQAEGNTLET